MTKTPLDSMTAPSGKAFQYSYSPGVDGALDTFGNAYSERSMAASVGLKISKNLLLEEPSA